MSIFTDISIICTVARCIGIPIVIALIVFSGAPQRYSIDLSWNYKKFSNQKKIKNKNVEHYLCWCPCGWAPSVVMSGALQNRKHFQNQAQNKQNHQFPCEINGFALISLSELVRCSRHAYRSSSSLRYRRRSEAPPGLMGRGDREGQQARSKSCPLSCPWVNLT